jgi:hypothetical protein
MTEPNTWIDSILRRLSRFGHAPWWRRWLERVGLIKAPEPPPWVLAMAASQAYERELNDIYAAKMQRVVNDAWQAAWDAYLEHERLKQDPAAWEAAERAERGGR